MAEHLATSSDFRPEVALSPNFDKLVPNHDKDISALIDAADGCPICIFSALRQCPKWALYSSTFNVEKEMKKFWTYHNRKEDEDEMARYCY